ncbi:KH domain-containing protein [Candidatus Daviesbacteria bacterium]|nr:KH domain-containing protein [Candidatus Daviesbacteria bacterium]
MKDLLNFIVTSIVTKPEALNIEEDNQEGTVNLTLTVDPSDMGLIIGKGGQTIKSIRKLLIVRAMAENVRVNLQLNEPASSQEIATSVDESTSSQ